MEGKIWAGTAVYVPSNGKAYQGVETGDYGRVVETAEAEAEAVLVVTRKLGTLRYSRSLLRPAGP